MSTVKSRHQWLSITDVQKYYKAVDDAFAMNQVIDGVSLDNKSNEEYKRDILECYRKALETVPMPSETPT